MGTIADMTLNYAQPPLGAQPNPGMQVPGGADTNTAGNIQVPGGAPNVPGGQGGVVLKPGEQTPLATVSQPEQGMPITQNGNGVQPPNQQQKQMPSGAHASPIVMALDATNTWNKLTPSQVLSAANSGQQPGSVTSTSPVEKLAVNQALMGGPAGGFGDANHPAAAPGQPQNANQFAGEMKALYSDEQLKTNITVGDKPIDLFLDNLGAHQYEYKDEKHGKGKHFSVMAQELEKAGDVGKSMVIDTPEGKKVDYARGLGVFLASAAMLNEKQRKMEKTINFLKEAIKNKKVK